MTINIETKYSRADDFSGIKGKLKKMKMIGLPSFVLDDLNIAALKKHCKPFMKYKNIIVIGNGGSVNSSVAIYETLGKQFGKRNKNFVFLTTMEPDYLNCIKNEYRKNDTLVIAVSKSGTTVGLLESLLGFINDKYPVLAITNKNEGVLLEIARMNGYPVIEHPEVGGRFSGRTSSSLIPAYLMGVDINELNKGCLEMYKKCSPKKSVNVNPALKLAATLYILEGKGKTDVFMPVYSVQLSGFLTLIIQLMHESFGKDGIGQTYFGGLSPETQHHTNQRFFGGRQNIAGLFIKVEKQNDRKSRISVPKKLEDIGLRGGSLKDIAGVSYEKALESEFMGTYLDAIGKKIPIAVLSVDRINAFSVGEFMAFWQYVAVYSSILRGVNPYDQPQVEESKEISFKMRQNYKKR